MSLTSNLKKAFKGIKMAGFDESFKSIIIANPAKLSLKNKSLIVSRDNFDDVALPLKDLAYVVLESPQITITSALLSSIAENKIALLSCNDSHTPNGIFLPYLYHYQSNAVIKKQINQSLEQKALLWQKIIQVKISNQAKVLEKYEKSHVETLKKLSLSVKLGDSKNNEAIAANKYFKALFGDDFSRNEPCYENSALNYAYSIIRACVTRNIVVSGLLGIFGINHDNMFNNFNLADDLMEPFRPYGDDLIINLYDESKDMFLESKDKLEIIRILDSKVRISGKNFTLAMAISKCVQSYKNSIESGNCDLDLPEF
ncbi:MAG: type II CRISPR-associated endonuclease Cas1 [Campylobacter sp.]|uniref:type II CRISPR-associated endonuclease Cas1 n=2 Tax=Campylobacter sp. TaxID=205 RepID=UPI002AA87828|nr:type II CRISPR-associated endonuclease Cas1 [Campylobacter sp.]MCI7022770.1 type II CRISPR-associated endonuclease Cas1 [Campylobacter sp.]MCI7581812.1 type II CRISPR-associated endonuclease Cas1 [Campylobacter sp.]